MLEEVKENLYKINKNQYLKVNKKGNGLLMSPIQKDPLRSFWEKGNKNYFNIFIGSYSKLFWIILIVLLLIGLSWSYARDTKVCREQRENLPIICADLARIQSENKQNTELPAWSVNIIDDEERS